MGKYKVTMKLKPGKILDAYFDGKPSPSRYYPIRVMDVVRIENLPKKYLRMWKRAIVDDFNESLLWGCVVYIPPPQRFWDWNCGEFIIGKNIGDDAVKEPILFAKRPHGWYGVNYNYKLDVYGKVRKEYMETWQGCAKELGQVLMWDGHRHEFRYSPIESGKAGAPC